MGAEGSDSRFSYCNVRYIYGNAGYIQSDWPARLSK